jgi:hypothetical protein
MKDQMEKAKLSCKLSTPELMERKNTIIAELKSLVRERNEIKNGVQYTFESSDRIIDLISNFIKTERLCCDFFDFNLNISADPGSMQLTLSGPDGTKEFIKEEIGF